MNYFVAKLNIIYTRIYYYTELRFYQNIGIIWNIIYVAGILTKNHKLCVIIRKR